MGRNKIIRGEMALNPVAHLCPPLSHSALIVPHLLLFCTSAAVTPRRRAPRVGEAHNWNSDTLCFFSPAFFLP